MASLQERSQCYYGRFGQRSAAAPCLVSNAVAKQRAEIVDLTRYLWGHNLLPRRRGRDAIRRVLRPYPSAAPECLGCASHRDPDDRRRAQQLPPAACPGTRSRLSLDVALGQRGRLCSFRGANAHLERLAGQGSGSCASRFDAQTGTVAAETDEPLAIAVRPAYAILPCSLSCACLVLWSRYLHHIDAHGRSTIIRR